MYTNTTLRRTICILLLALTVVVSYSVLPDSQTYAASKKPAKVTGVKASAASSSSIKITWKKAKNAKKYQVYRATSKKGKYKKVTTTKGKSYTNKSLKSGTTYYYKVRAVNGKKKGKFSAVKSAKTKPASNSMAAVKVDTEQKTVTIKAKVNGKYFSTSTRHLMIDQNGFNKGKSLLTSYCSPDDLYNGLVKAGGVSWSKSADKNLEYGEKITEENAENANYSRIDVTLNWDNETRDLDEVLTTVKGGSDAPQIDMVFSGNPGAAKKTPSGCMACLDSCYIGIVSNAAYGLCVIDNGNPTVYGRAEMLPDDGKIIDVTFRVK